MSRGVRLYIFLKYYIFCLKIFFTLTNSIDPDEMLPDEMLHYAVFHLSLDCL